MQCPQPVPWIAHLAPAVHGSVDASPLGPVDGLLDFSANGNVLGPAPGVANAMAAVDPARYPDRQALALRQALAARHNVSPDAVVVGNGSTELIWAVARAYLAPGDPALIVGPTYGEYAVAAAAAGAKATHLDGAGPSLDPAAPSPEPAVLSRLRSVLGTPLAAFRTLWLCHPNNPTGVAFPIHALPELIALAPSTLFVVDEAYLTLADGVSTALPWVAGGHAVVLRSLTKDAALAGLRVGYAVAAPAVADALRRALPPWSVSAVAQAAALAALADATHAAHVRAAVAASRAHLMAGLQGLGLHPYPSRANFVLVPVGDAPGLTRALLAHGCTVRDCTSFGLPDCIRIGVRSLADQEVLLRAIAAHLPAQPA